MQAERCRLDRMPIDRLTAYARIGERRRIRRAALDCIGALRSESDKYAYHADAIAALEFVVASHESEIDSLEDLLLGANEIGAPVAVGAADNPIRKRECNGIRRQAKAQDELSRARERNAGGFGSQLAGSRGRAVARGASHSR